jgi:hypothetical protein
METSSLSELTRPIGDRVFIDPYFLQLKPSETCYGCFFFRRGCSPSCTRHSFIPDSERGGISYENATERLGPCSLDFRIDKRGAIFKVVMDLRELDADKL